MKEISISWRKLYTSLLQKPWFKKPNCVSLYIYLLLNAYWLDGEDDGVEIKRGQCLISFRKAAEDCGISLQNLKSALRVLEKDGEVTHEVTRKVTRNITHAATIVTICEFDIYQEVFTDDNTLLNTVTNTQGNTHSNRSYNRSLIDRKEKIKRKEKEPSSISACIEREKTKANEPSAEDKFRERVIGMVEGAKQNPKGSSAKIVEKWQKDGTLARLGIVYNQK